MRCHPSPVVADCSIATRSCAPSDPQLDFGRPRDDDCHFNPARTSGLVRIDDHRHRSRRDVLQERDWLDVGSIPRLAGSLHRVQAHRRRAGRRPDADPRRHEHAAVLVDVRRGAEARGDRRAHQAAGRQRTVRRDRRADRRPPADAEGSARAPPSTSFSRRRRKNARRRHPKWARRRGTS